MNGFDKLEDLQRNLAIRNHPMRQACKDVPVKNQHAGLLTHALTREASCAGFR